MSAAPVLRWFHRRVRRKGRFLGSLLVALGAAFLHLVVFTASFGKQVEYRLSDLWFSVRGPVVPPSKILIVAIDESSFERLNVSNLKALPRSYIAEAAMRFKAYGVKRAIFDLFFTDKGEDPAEDQALALALRSVPSMIGSFYGRSFATGLTGNLEVREAKSYPQEMFASSAADVAAMDLILDSGYVRRFAVTSEPNSKFPVFLRAFAAAESIAKVPGARDLINYYGSAGGMRSVPFFQVIEDRELRLAEYFRDSFVFVGLQRASDTPKSLKDEFLTPPSGRLMSGVEIFATIAANLLEERWVQRPPLKQEVVALNLAGFLIAFFIAYLAPLWAFACLITVFVVWAIGSYWAFTMGHFIAGATLFAIVLPLAFTVSVIRHYIAVRRTQQRIESTFSVKLQS